jgi:photosystem II stability/assembly factor-like uncharacterized protein
MNRLTVLALSLVVLFALPAADSGASASSTPVISFHWLRMIDSERGYALSGDNPNAYRLLWTSDGGHHWADVTPGRGRIHPLSTLSVFGFTRLFSIRLGAHRFAVERSSDGGRTWRLSLPFVDPNGEAAGQPYALDARHLFLAVVEGAAAGSQGQALFTSSDGGLHWRLISHTSPSSKLRGSLPFGCDKNGFAFATPSRGWAGGYCAGGAPFFYRTDDGGHSWHRQALSAPRECACDTSAPLFFSPTVGAVYVIGFAANGRPSAPIARVLWTYDAGRTWAGHLPQLGRVEQVAFATARSVWITAQTQTTPASPAKLLLRTDDAGAHWQSLLLRFNADDYRFDALSPSTAFAFKVGTYSSTLIVSHDGGQTWQPIQASLARDHA